jgi:hypothetical protein
VQIEIVIKLPTQYLVCQSDGLCKRFAGVSNRFSNVVATPRTDVESLHGNQVIAASLDPVGLIANYAWRGRQKSRHRSLEDRRE